MGLYDEIKCEYPLPVDGANDLLYQTKDTDVQYLDLYEIREDGTLWHEIYDTEDQSDPNAKGIMKMAGCMTRINKRWESVPLTGEIVFYNCQGKMDLRFSAYFVNGKLNQIHRLNGD